MKTTQITQSTNTKVSTTLDTTADKSTEIARVMNKLGRTITKPSQLQVMRGDMARQGNNQDTKQLIGTIERNVPVEPPEMIFKKGCFVDIPDS